jgi:hypothetical protein
MWCKIHPKYDNCQYSSHRCKVPIFIIQDLTNSKSGEKCKHAQDWGIDVVNHLWLEETYAKWQVQSVTVPRYTHFPPQTNLTEIVDKTEIQDEGIIDFYTPQEDEVEETTDVNHIEHPPKVSDTTSQNVQSSCVSVDKKTLAATSKTSASISTAKPQETPALGPSRAQTPGSNRRKAAENAITKLHNEIMPDVLLWEKEKNRKRIPEESLSQPKDSEKKRKTESRKSEEKENIIEGVAKKFKKDSNGVKDLADLSNKITLVVTGITDDLTTGNTLKVWLSIPSKI